MRTFIAILIFVPGALEAAAFLLSLLVICLLNRRFSATAVANAVITASGLLAMLELYGGYPRYLYLATLAAMALIALMAKLGKKPLIAFPTAALILAAMYWQYSTVEPTVTIPGRWKIGARGVKAEGNPEQRLVTFQLSANEFISAYSDELAAYLEKRRGRDTLVTLELMYHWGKFAGVELKQVDGKTFPAPYGSASVHCGTFCGERFYGPRGL